ncbi:MAG: MATE family efflux transporter [Peptostreptococcaceae bacterium]
MDRAKRLGEEHILKLILKLSPPIMFSLLIQSLYNIIDSIFIAKYSEVGLTAVSLVFPIQLLMIALASGTGVGVNTIISKFIGENKYKEACKVTANGIISGIINWVVFMILGLLSINLYFKISSSNIEVVSMGISYAKTILIFSFGIFIESNISKMLQATGNMTIPMIAQVVGAIINIILDPILIFGHGEFLGLGIKGAAIATILGQIVAMIISLYFLLKSELIKTQDKKLNLINKNSIISIYKMGFPSIVMQSLYTIYIMGLNLILAGFSDNAVTVLGIYYKLQTFFFIPLFGFQQAVLPVISYNFGAKNRDRVWNTIKYSIILASIFLAFGTAIFVIIPKELISVFSTSSEIISIGIPALKIISLSFIPAAISLMVPIFFQSIGYSRESILLTILRQIVLFVPVAYVLSLFGLEAVWFTFPLTEIVTAVVSIIFINRNKSKINKLMKIDKLNKQEISVNAWLAKDQMDYKEII